MEEGEKPLVDIASLDTYSLLGLFVSLLSVKAWQDMGLRIAPGKGKIERDFERARVAIDCVAFMIDKLEQHVSFDERNKLRSLLTDLQINFVQQSSTPQT